jgi:Uma2 family endonuclease
LGGEGGDMPRISKTRVSTQEFLELAETRLPTELISGEVIVKPIPNLIHQRLVFRAAHYLQMLVQIGDIFVAPVDIVFDVDNVLQPDVFWVAPDSLCEPVEDRYFHGSPDLVIEILSPTTARRDRDVKFVLYEKYGAREYWLIDPDARFVEVYRRNDERLIRLGFFGQGEKFTSPVLENSTLDVDTLFFGT